MLKLSNISAGYGLVQILNSISLEVKKGEIISVIGANGAGKTTTMNVISGSISQKKGSIIFDGQDISDLSPYKRVGLGLVQVPEGRHVFGPLTVQENLTMGYFSKRKNKNRFAERLDFVYELFPKLYERKVQKAGSLSGGEQQMLVISRALISDPKLLLLDEPSLGLSPLIVDHIFDVITKLNQQGLSILLVEQNAFQTLSISDRTYLIESGEIVKSGNSQELMKDPKIMEVYLGKEAEEVQDANL